MSATLEMTFVNQAGNKVTLRVANPREDITDTEVRTAMDTVIAKNVFSSSGGDLVSVAGARIVSREVTEIDVL